MKKEVGHGGEEREGSGPRLLSRGRVQELGVPEMGPLPQAFISFLQAGILGKASALQVRPFRVMVLTGWSVTGQGAFSHCSWSWSSSPGFAAFLGLGLKYN